MAINKLIFAFVTLILGIALLSQVAILTNATTGKSDITNESITIIKNATNVNETYVYQLAQSPTGWKSLDCPVTNFQLTNTSDAAAWTITTDYTITLSNGTLLLVNNSDTQFSADNLTYANYNYCSDDYLNSGWGRTLVNLVSGFFAISLLLVSIALFYSVAKETGLI